eukprot:GEMP01032924.1.p1 GENE.GEMP01032924.1~~GEMP01032924.1.p1  ORF type:complete len:332 (+),score=45.70 GEMP01032924.1:115-1110(+)
MAMFEICCRRLYKPCGQDALCCSEQSCVEYDTSDLTPHGHEINSGRRSWDEVEFKSITSPEAHPLDVQPRYQHVVRSNPRSVGPCIPNESISCETLHIAVLNEEPCLVRSYGRYAIFATPRPEICVAQVCDKDWTVRMPLTGTEMSRLEEGGPLWQFLGSRASPRTVEFNHGGLRVWLIERSVSRANALIECVDGVRGSTEVLTDFSRDVAQENTPYQDGSPSLIGTPHGPSYAGRVRHQFTRDSIVVPRDSSVLLPLAPTHHSVPLIPLPPVRVSIDRSVSPMHANNQGMTPITMSRIQAPYRFVGQQPNVRGSLLSSGSRVSLVPLEHS